MTLTRSRVVAGASGFAGEPPDEPLPTGVPMWLRFEIVADLETELMREANLSTQNRTMSKVPVRLIAGNREFSLPGIGIEDAAYITLNTEGTASLVPLPIEISDISVVEADAGIGRRTVAFTSDKPQRGLLSWVPGNDETLTIWYDRSPVTDPSADLQTFSITDSYVPLLKLLLAAQMIELMKQPLGEVLRSRIARGMKQWDKFVRKGKQQGIIKKTSYRSQLHNQGASQWDAWPGRVNFD
jgi:hypothetical protein